MSSESLLKITDLYPEERRAIQRLARLVSADRERQYTLDSLYRATGASSPSVLALILSDLVGMGLARRMYRVESPFTRAGLGDYEDVERIPREVRDQVVERTFTPTPDNVKTIYFLGKPGASRQRDQDEKPARRGFWSVLLRPRHDRVSSGHA